MTHEEHEQILADVLANLSDQAKVSESLDKLRSDYTETLASAEIQTSAITDLTSKNEKLREVNSNLFLKVGDLSSLGSNSIQMQTKEPEELPKKKYDDLFDEKGVLK